MRADRSSRALLLGALTIAATLSAPAAAIAAKAPKETASASELSRLAADIQALSRRVSPAVVQVFVTGLAPPDNESGELLSRQSGSGSGIIVDPQGYIVTNAHVVSGARRVRVLLSSPRPGAPGHSTLKARGPLYDAKVVGSDRETDVAVLKIEGSGHPTLSFADSDQLKQGQLVFAFGSPLGLENSVSMGVLSSTARQLEPESPMIYLQTDASINPGNSGGPLVDDAGRVVGINTFIAVSVGDAVGFAAPSNIVRSVYEQIRAHGRVRRGVIGVSAQTLTPELARALGLSRDWGVVLGDVYPGGPADRAGLRAGDVVLTLDGKVMENGRQLEVNLYRRQAGEEASLEILREGEKRVVPVRLTQRGDVDRIAELVNNDNNLIEPLHILGLAVDAELASTFPMREPWGVLVAASAADPPPEARRSCPETSSARSTAPRCALSMTSAGRSPSASTATGRRSISSDRAR